MKYSKIFQILMLQTVLFLQSCMEAPTGVARRGAYSNLPAETPIEVNGPEQVDGPSATRTEETFGSDSVGEFKRGKPEIIHIINPESGSFRKKVTIPKNFNGYLKISGLNITSLNDHLPKVRFTFGRELEQITLPAIVARTDGITPQSDIEVLIIDMTNRPFKDVRLLYDLYDYNDYTTDGNEEVTEPMSDPSDTGLFCRGLRLEHDPTFDFSPTNSKCDQADEVCKYAFAKVIDTALYRQSRPLDGESQYIGVKPTSPLIDATVTGSVSQIFDPQAGVENVVRGLDNEPVDRRRDRCLPDSLLAEEVSLFLNPTAPINALSHDMPIFLSGDNETEYRYRGPYRRISESDWEIEGDAITGTKVIDGESYRYGIFKSLQGDQFGENNGYDSLLFPRRGKVEIRSGVEHISTSKIEDTPWGSMDKQQLSISGDSGYMYGCNIRAQNYDSFTNEGIQSCNVTAKIEILIETPADSAFGSSQDVVVAETIETKLQLVRASVRDFKGDSVLYSEMRTCANSQECASDECCFNNRCWHTSLVSQCKESVEPLGFRKAGVSCGSDLECESFCCKGGACSIHARDEVTENLCSKSTQQTCVTQEFCAKTNVTECRITITSRDVLGRLECALRCFNVPRHNLCINNKCVKRNETGTIPQNFDPTNPDCTNAQFPPLNGTEISLQDFLDSTSSQGSGDEVSNL